MNDNELLLPVKQVFMSSFAPSKFRNYLRLFWMLVAAPIIVLFFIVSATTFGLFGPLPSFEELENPKTYQATEIFSSDLKILGKYYIENRTIVHYNEISPNLVNFKSINSPNSDSKIRNHSLSAPLTNPDS